MSFTRQEAAVLSVKDWLSASGNSSNINTQITQALLQKGIKTIFLLVDDTLDEARKRITVYKDIKNSLESAISSDSTTNANFSVYIVFPTDLIWMQILSEKDVCAYHRANGVTSNVNDKVASYLTSQALLQEIGEKPLAANRQETFESLCNKYTADSKADTTSQVYLSPAKNLKAEDVRSVMSQSGWGIIKDMEAYFPACRFIVGKVAERFMLDMRTLMCRFLVHSDKSISRFYFFSADDFSVQAINKTFSKKSKDFFAHVQVNKNLLAKDYAEQIQVVRNRESFWSCLTCCFWATEWVLPKTALASTEGYMLMKDDEYPPNTLQSQLAAANK